MNNWIHLQHFQSNAGMERRVLLSTGKFLLHPLFHFFFSLSSSLLLCSDTIVYFYSIHSKPQWKCTNWFIDFRLRRQAVSTFNNLTFNNLSASHSWCFLDHSSNFIYSLWKEEEEEKGGTKKKQKNVEIKYGCLLFLTLQSAFKCNKIVYSHAAEVKVATSSFIRVMHSTRVCISILGRDDATTQIRFLVLSSQQPTDVIRVRMAVTRTQEG